MNGATDPGRSMPPASPHAATAPPERVIDSTLASVVEPTESTAAAQRSLASGFGAPLNVARSMISSAPSSVRYSVSCNRPVEAITRQPAQRSSAIATEPTPPAAPVTTAGPASGVRPCRSIAISASIAV